MNERDRGRVGLAGLMLLALCVFLTGIGWGLPSRRVDPYLFGDHPVWSGERIAQLAGERGGAQLGADVDVNPVVRGGEPVVLNDTDQKRAEIIRRYRLFTYQPDEMITMMALSAMKPGEGKLDPKLYQYGGLWIYPIGLKLEAASLLKLVTLAPAQAYYLDHPEAFGRLYIIARLYTVGWALIGVWAVFRIAHRAGAGLLGAAGAALLFIFLPVVENMSHEAKPHLPGAVLILLAAMAAGRFINTGGRRWWIVTGALCGASTGMVLSGLVSILILPAMLFMRPISWSRRMGVFLAASAIAAGVYFATNPYVLVHLLGYERAVLQSNLGNSAAMYQFGQLGRGFLNAARLVGEGATPLVAIVGLLAAILALRSKARFPIASLQVLIIVAVVVLAQFIALAVGKAGEYGRFAILPDIVLALSAAVLIGRAGIRSFEKVEALGIVLLLAVLPSAIYLRGFAMDASAYPRRIEYARILAALKQMGAQSLAVYDEPAPYLLPPVNVFEWTIELLPRGFNLASGQTPADVIVRPVDTLKRGPVTVGAYERLSDRTFDDLFPAKIGWAGKPMEIWVRRKAVRP